MKTKRKAAASSQKYRGKQSYGIGGAVMTLGKNLLQGKKLGSGAFKGVLRAGITPGSGIGAGMGLVGALAGRSKNPTMQKIGKGLGIAGNVAGMFTGRGGGGALGGLAGKFAGADKALHGLGKGMQGAGGVLPFLAQNVFKAEDGMKMPYAYGGKMKIMKEGGLVGGQKKLDKNNDGKISGEDFKMLMGGGKVEYMDGGKMYDEGGEVEPNGEGVEPLTNKEFRQNEKFQRQAERQARPYQRADDTEELLDMLDNSENVEERQLILKQLVRMLGIAGTGAGVSAYFASPGMSRSRIRRFIRGN